MSQAIDKLKKGLTRQIDSMPSNRQARMLESCRAKDLESQRDGEQMPKALDPQLSRSRRAKSQKTESQEAKEMESRKSVNEMIQAASETRNTRKKEQKEWNRTTGKCLGERENDSGTEDWPIFWRLDLKKGVGPK